MSNAKLASFIERWRLYLVLFIMFLCLLAIGWKVGGLYIVKREFLQNEGDRRTIRTVPLVANRGVIMDRNGEPLAVSSPVISIYVKPREINNLPAEIGRLAAELDLDADSLSQSINRNRGKEFLFIRRWLVPAEADRILKLNIAGVHARQEYQRFYPQGEAAAHLVGLFSDSENEGLEGLELVYEEWLKGVPGKRQVIRDRLENTIKELNIIQAAQPGRNLELSIDFRLQNLAYKELKEEFVARRAKSASIVVLDVDTGEVLAMANQPSYNPHNRKNLKDFSILRNRAITDVFEPGSPIKAFTVAAALESGLYTPQTVIETSPGWMMVNGKEVQDIINYGTLDLTSVITKSSNIGATKIAFEIGPDAIRDVLERVGMGQLSGTGFPSEQGGVLPNHRNWSRIETATFSFGYGLSTTALQLARAYSVIADDGIRKPVSLLKLDEASLQALPREQVIDKTINNQVLAMLETVVDPARGGSARDARVPFYKVAGKTGTVHVVSKHGGYEENLHNSLFVGLVPASDPKLVIVVIVNEPKGDEHYGGQVAAPVFSRVASGAMRILNIAPDDLPVDASRELSSL